MLTNRQDIWRLQSPYSSKCNNGNDNSSIFPKPYTVTKCRNTCLFNMMLSKCEDVIQQWQQFLPECRLFNKSKGVRGCLIDVLQTNDRQCSCPVGCYETYFDKKMGDQTFRDQYSLEDLRGPASISFQYLSKTATEIREKPAYPATQFITDIGGWLSLFTGMSALSLLEVLIFVFLSINVLRQKFKVRRRIGIWINWQDDNDLFVYILILRDMYVDM